MKQSELNKEIRDVLNQHSRENPSNTPDFILADYLEACLVAFENASNQRTAWHSNNPTTVGTLPTEKAQAKEEK